MKKIVSIMLMALVSVMTLQEFKKKYIDKPEVVNDYQIY